MAVQDDEPEVSFERPQSKDVKSLNTDLLSMVPLSRTQNFPFYAARPAEDNEDDSFFVADLGEVYRQHVRWLNCLPRVKPFYAVKCNPDPEVLRLLHLLGTGFDCSSRQEMEAVLALGVEPDRIIYAQPSKHNSHLRFARRNRVHKMTFDGAEELYKIKAIFPEAHLLLRIVTDDSSSVCRFSAKFGAPMSSTLSLLQLAKELGLNIIGVSFHIGSAATDPQLFAQAVRDSKTVFEEAEQCGFSLRLLDVGGGFSDESFESMATTLRAALDASFPSSSSSVQVIAEPGRYFVATAFTVVCSIIARRQIFSRDDNNNNNNGGQELHFMLTLNDGVYTSFMDCLLSHWQPQPHILDCASQETGSRQQQIRYMIWGPTCDGIDQVVQNTIFYRLLDVGDRLYFPRMGAYSLCLATSFNGFSNERMVHHVSSENATKNLLGY